MWFKNLRAFRLTTPFDLTAEQLHDKLQSGAFTPCAKSQPLSLGWVAPLGREATDLVHAANRRLLICMRREERLLPASVVREMVDEKVAGLEQEQDRKVRRREKESIRDEIVQDCLPRAFTRSSLVYALVDAQAGWIFVDSPSAGRAEDLCTLLRDSLGTLPLLLPEVVNAPSAVMTSWLQYSNLPEGFALGTDCELKEPEEDGAIVRFTRQDLASEEVQAHLEAGKRVTRVNLQWQDQLSFQVSEDLTLKRLRFADTMLQSNEDIDSEDPAARFDADFVLMSELLSPLYERLLNYFGGELRDG